MKKIIILIIGALIIVTLLVFWIKRSQSPVVQTTVQLPQVTGFSLKTNEFQQGAKIPLAFTCDGANTSPAMSIVNVPKNTKSLALIVDDIDTPQQTWVHWLVWNMQPETTAIPAGSIPKGAVVGTNSFGKTTYGGPCPQSARHRYVFRLYALDTYLVLSPTAIKKDVIDAMNTHVIGQTELMGYYER
jgi:Raf kinase inhibitor-like YbhB/YbcL family protein